MSAWLVVHTKALQERVVEVSLLERGKLIVRISDGAAERHVPAARARCTATKQPSLLLQHGQISTSAASHTGTSARDANGRPEDSMTVDADFVVAPSPDAASPERA